MRWGRREEDRKAAAKRIRRYAKLGLSQAAVAARTGYRRMTVCLYWPRTEA